MFLMLLLYQAALFAIATMLLTWIVATRIRNASIVDISWSALFSVIVVFYAALGDGYLPRRIAIAVMVSLWSLRLAGHLLVRIKSRHPAEDPRYARIRAAWGARADWRFLLFFELQGILSLVLSVPFALACLNRSGGFSTLELFGTGVCLAGIVGESLADRQLGRFKADPKNQGRTMDLGLWRYSRHPNYFFEWVVWCGYFLYALSSPWGWVTVYCPVLMYYVLTRVTGIPLVEELSLKSRRDEYRSYQERTSAFFPWFPKKQS